MLIVVVEFIIDPEHLAEFMPLMLNNARTSLAEEPGCHQFDVCASEEAPAHILLYEVYDDATAFETHVGSAHFKEFATATGKMITERSIRRIERKA